MDVYQIFVDLKEGVRDHQFVEAVGRYMGALEADGKIESWRLLRAKLGLGGGLGEFQLLIETKDLAQLDAAFQYVSTRADPVESQHHGVNSLVTNFRAALYRDFPDPHRARGQEKF